METYKDTQYYITQNGDVIRDNLTLRKSVSKGGYQRIVLNVNGGKVSKLIHRLVAETYLPNPNNLPEVDHRDTNKLNNDISNLEWVTTEENKRRARLNGLIKKGESHGKSKLTKTDVEYIRNNYIPRHKEYGMRALGKKFNVQHMTISNIINKITWRD
jgi:hypothetical protein